MIIPKHSKDALLNEMRSYSLPYMYMYGIGLFPLDSIKTILDIGANCGLYSVAFRFFHPNARIISIEPDKENYNNLIKNTANLDIETFNIALGNGDEVVKISGKCSLAHSFSNIPKEVSGQERCSSLLLSSIIEKYNIDLKGLFIKIDTEGGEYVIFGHFPSEYVIRNSMGLSMEVHHCVPNVIDKKETVVWANKFSNSHKIFCSSHRRWSHISIFLKEIFNE
jgi:FkbM family methyltransferase